MNWKIIFTIAKKDFLEARQNKAVWQPIFIVPLMFIVLLPVAMILAVTFLSTDVFSLTSDPDMAKFLANMPPALTQAIAGLDDKQTMIVLMLGFVFAPFFLILPLMFSTVIASESFAGERERKTIEALLYTPVTDTELFLGKVLAAFIPAVGITWISFIAYIIIVNSVGYPVMGRVWFPLTNWYPLTLWVSPALSLLGISATVLISAKTQTFMGAYQTSSSLVVLILGLMVGQITGVLYLSTFVGLVIGLVILVLAVILMVYAIRTFNREKLLISSAV